MKHPIDSKSFTLIELLIAIFILAVGIVGVLQAFPLGTRIASFSKMSTVATQLAQAKIEEEISKSYAEILCNATLPPCQTPKTRVSTDPQNPFYHYWRKMRLDYVNPAAGLATTTSDTGIKKIEVVVFFKSPLGVSEKEVKITSLISRR